MSIQLPPPPVDPIGDSPTWRDWFTKLRTVVSTGQGTGSGILSGTLPVVTVGLPIGASYGRQLVAGTNVTLTDNGPGKTLILSSVTNITSAAVITALGYTPYNSTNPAGYISTTVGYSGVVTTTKLTAGGANGSMTFSNGLLVSQIQAT